MEREQTETVREVSAARQTEAAPLRRLPRRGSATTKQMHRRLLHALRDNRIKRALSAKR